MDKLERTLSILKPDAVRKGITGKINSYIEQSGLRIIAQKRILLTKSQAEAFYFMHKSAEFFDELIEFMTSGAVTVQVLLGFNAVSIYRKLMGATDPKNAEKGSIRSDFAISIDENCVHGSDSLENADREIRFFFSECEIIC